MFLWKMAILFIFETAGLMPVITLPTWEFVLHFETCMGSPSLYYLFLSLSHSKALSFCLKFCNSIVYFKSHAPPTMEKTAADIVTKHQPHLCFVCLKNLTGF